MGVNNDDWAEFVARAEGLDPRPEEASLYALWRYHGQVCNGGHHQYFWNLHDQTDDWERAVGAAAEIGCADIADLLKAAIAVWRGKPRNPGPNAMAFLASSREGEFDEFDDLFAAREAALEAAMRAAAAPAKEA